MLSLARSDKISAVDRGMSGRLEIQNQEGERPSPLFKGEAKSLPPPSFKYRYLFNNINKGTLHAEPVFL